MTLSCLDVHRFSQLSSTQAQAKSLLAQQLSRGKDYVVVAEEQTHGQGRQGRSWISGQGNIALTFGLFFVHDCDVLLKLPYVAALYILRVVRVCLSSCGCNNPTERLHIKWPNDLLVDGKKCAGILIDTQNVESKLFVALGVGINVSESPRGIEQSSRTDVPSQQVGCLGDLFDAGLVPQDLRQIIEDQLLEKIADLHDLMKCDRRDLYSQWLEVCAGYRQRVIVYQGKTMFEGVFAGLSDEGALCLQQSQGGIKTFSAAEVRLRFGS